MKAKLLNVSELRERANSVDKEAFVAEYPGVFLVAMGVLEAQPLGGKRPGTVALVFGDRLRHEAGQAHPLAGQAFFLRSSQEPLSVVLGRSDECDLTIPDPSVSERHCLIHVTERGVEAIDLGSTNGTTLNLTRLSADEPGLLGDEDILSLGRYSFQVLSSATCYAALRLLQALESTPPR